jgi:hypothetical protein
MSIKKKACAHVIFYDRMFDFDVSNAISQTECTGLIPWAPRNSHELDAYDEIISYSPESANIYSHTE